jgi:glycosyltransferase involved in cell wall biosynthesis
MVRWQGPKQTQAFLYAADVLIIPPTTKPLERSGRTVLPIKVFQYLATGRAILAPAAADLLEVLEDGRNAALVPPDDLDAAVRKLEELAGSPDARERLASLARADASRYTWEDRAARVLSFLRARVGEATRPTRHAAGSDA